MIDLHCDTVMMLTDKPEQGSLRQNPWKVDIQKLQKAKAKVQDFALFVELSAVADPHERYLQMKEVFFRELEANQDAMRLIRSYQDVTASYEDGKIGALLSVEEGGVFKGSLELLRQAYEDGVRLVTISWNFPNEISFPHGAAHEGKGLTPFGVEFVQYMEELGMIVDCSHLNDAGTRQLGEILTKPFIASHSNARALVPHTRNLTDDLIRLIAEKGGVVGLNFSKNFLGTSPISLISDIVRHGLHIRQVGGSEVLALGTDFDGIAPTTEIEDIGEMGKLYDAFLEAGLTQEETDKIFWKNADRVLKEIL